MKNKVKAIEVKFSTPSAALRFKKSNKITDTEILNDGFAGYKDQLCESRLVLPLYLRANTENDADIISVDEIEVDDIDDMEELDKSLEINKHC